jgi:hypothetical protein
MGDTPSPVKQVLQYERDSELATKLQQEYDDEVKAEQMAAVAQIEDEFEAATRKADEERAQRALARIQDA